MTIPIADDFSFIRQRLAELEAKPASSNDNEARMFWCDDCQKEIPAGEVTPEGLHNEHMEGCGCIVHPSCDKCENGGWVQVFSHHPPCCGVCQSCFNPFGHPNPC
jgi:hypothetical protein